MLKESEVGFGKFFGRSCERAHEVWVITRVVGVRFEARTLDGATASVFHIGMKDLMPVDEATARRRFANLRRQYRRRLAKAQSIRSKEGVYLCEGMLESIAGVQRSLKTRNFRPLA